MQIMVICFVTFIVWEMNTNISGEILHPFQGHLNPEDVDTVIPRLTKIIRSGITFVSRNVIMHY